MKKQRLITQTAYHSTAWFLKHWQVGKRPIFIVGHGRSGTSWIGRTLSVAARVIYYYEPCSPVITGHGDLATWFRYLRIGERDTLFEHAFDSAFGGLPFGYGWHWGFYNRPWPNYQIIVKDVASLMSIEWVADRYDPEMMIIVRHPCATILSEIDKETPIQHSLEVLLNQQNLFEDHLEPYRTHIENARTPLEILATIWATRYRVVVNALAKHPDWPILYYEDLCHDPLSEFRKLYDHFDLPWTDRVAKYVQKTSTTEVPGRYSGVRVSAKQLDKWKAKMTQEQVDTVRRCIEVFELPFYQGNNNWEITLSSNDEDKQGEAT